MKTKAAALDELRDPFMMLDAAEADAMSAVFRRWADAPRRPHEAGIFGMRRAIECVARKLARDGKSDLARRLRRAARNALAPKAVAA